MTTLRLTSRRALLPRVAAIALSPVLLTQSARAQSADWGTYRPESFDFEIEMPGKPSITIETGERDGPLVRSIRVEIDFDGLYFGAGCQELTQTPSVEEVSTAQRMAARQLGIRVSREAAISTMDGFPVVNVVNESDALSMAVQTIIMDRRSISAVVSGGGRLSENPSVHRFLDSLKLLP